MGQTVTQVLKVFCLIASTVFFAYTLAYSASFDIQPIKIFFDARSRIDKLTIRNISDEELSLQVKVYSWSQQDKGSDQYQETSEIIVFPRILKIPRNEEKFIRVGTNLMPTTNEKTYRIYIEEIPAEASPTDGASVRMTMKIGIPVFLNPLKSDPRGTLQSFSIDKGKLSIDIRNTGNIHFIVTSLNFKGSDKSGKEIFTKELGGWYVLNGSTRTYEMTVPADVCNELSRIQVTAKTDRLTMNETFDVQKGMCGNAAK